MSEDLRCCGSGTCIIDAEGRCWCGQQWDGQKMCHVPLSTPHNVANPELSPSARTAGGDAEQTDRSASAR